MAKDYASSFYNSAAWRKAQSLHMQSLNYVCEACGAPACVVHHITYITPANIHDPEITLNHSNLKALCNDCHALEHKAKGTRLNGVGFDHNGDVVKVSNVFLVCGCIGAGKSTYVAENKSQSDLVVDLDHICAALMGEPSQPYLDHAPVLSVALEVRGLLYEIIRARRGEWQRAFVVTSVASIAEQRAIAQSINAEIIMINTPFSVCLERIKTDARRSGKENMFVQLAEKWQKDYAGSIDSSPPMRE